MSGYKGSKFVDRQSESANAKKAAIEKFKAKPKPDDPAVLARQDELKAIAAAREVRAAERRVARAAEEARLAEVEKERQREEQRRVAEEKARVVAEAAAAEALKAEQKNARDARYAARKARR